MYALIDVQSFELEKLRFVGGIGASLRNTFPGNNRTGNS